MMARLKVERGGSRRSKVEEGERLEGLRLGRGMNEGALERGTWDAGVTGREQRLGRWGIFLDWKFIDCCQKRLIVKR